MVNIWDPHFHIWDVSEVTQSGHDPTQLFAPKEDSVYNIDRYENDMAMEGFKLTGGVFVEAVSVCHVESDGPLFEESCLAETVWTSKEMDSSKLDYRVVASALWRVRILKVFLHPSSNTKGFAESGRSSTMNPPGRGMKKEVIFWKIHPGERDSLFWKNSECPLISN